MRTFTGKVFLKAIGATASLIGIYSAVMEGVPIDDAVIIGLMSVFVASISIKRKKKTEKIEIDIPTTVREEILIKTSPTG